MLDQNTFETVKREIDQMRDSLVVKRAKMEETKKRIADLERQIVQQGILDSAHLDDASVIAEIERLEAQLMESYQQLKDLDKKG